MVLAVLYFVIMFDRQRILGIWILRYIESNSVVYYISSPKKKPVAIRRENRGQDQLVYQRCVNNGSSGDEELLTRNC
jgi:hypothetical protein